MIQNSSFSDTPYSKMDQNNTNNVQPSTEQVENSPYFQLMTAVGTHGPYQIISMIIWCFIWLTCGTVLLGTPFLMYNAPYICPSNNNQNMTSEECQQYVCSLPDNDRQKYMDQNSLTSVANSFGDLHCQSSWVVDVLSSLVYLGSFFGYISISIMVDNMGRKKSILISFAVGTLGLILLAVSPNLILAGIGLFLMGSGTDSAVNICFYFITETMEAKHRQKYCILVQVFFCLGGITNIAYYYIVKNWRIIFWVFLASPSVVCVFALFFVIKDTPYFLIKLKSRQKVLQQLQYIYKLNNQGNEMSLVKQNQLKNLIVQLEQLQIQADDNQKNQQNIDNRNQSSPARKHKIFTPLDLFRYKSIRFISIFICILSFSIYILYYGPLMLIDKLSYNMYVNALVVTVSELVTYPFTYFYIHRIPRRKIGIILYSVCGAVTFALIFVIANQCDQSVKWNPCHFLKVLQLVLIFIFRFCSSLQFAIFLLYSNEIFPTQIRGIGLGVSSALGTIASTASPYIFGSSLKNNSQTSRIMIVFVVISVMGAIIWWNLSQTLNQPIIDQIKEAKDEVGQLTQRQRQQNKDGHVQLVEVRESD